MAPLDPPLVDTHAHLTHERFQEDLPQVLTRARQAGLGAILCVGYTVDSSEAALRLAEEYPFLRASVGLHPHEAEEADPQTWSRLERLLEHPLVAAVGETGLDFHRPFASPRKQQENLRQHLRWARERGLPLILHNRDSDEAMMRLLDEEEGWRLSGVFHCFSGGVELARRAVEAGFLLGVDGPLTYPKAQGLRSLVASFPLEHWLLETDCPYLPPQPVRGQRNEPAYVRFVAEALAAAQGTSLEEVARQTTANACRLFPALREALQV